MQFAFFSPTIDSPLLSQGASPQVYFPSSSRLTSACVPCDCRGSPVVMKLPWRCHLRPRLQKNICSTSTRGGSGTNDVFPAKSECCAVTSINIHVWLCSRRPPVLIKAVLPLPFASRVLWKDIPDLTDVAEVESMCFPPTDASAAVCSSFIMPFVLKNCPRRFTGGIQR